MNRKVKKIVSVTMILGLIMVAAVFMVGCGEEKEAKETVSTTFDALKKLDFKTVNEHLSIEDYGKEVSEDEEFYDYTKSEKLGKAVFANFTYEIISTEKVDSEEVTVKTKIKNKDLGTAIKNWNTEINSDKFIASFLTTADDKLDAAVSDAAKNLLIEKLEDKTLKDVETTINIRVVKIDDVWKIDGQADLQKAVFGGMLEEMEALGE